MLLGPRNKKGEALALQFEDEDLFRVPDDQVFFETLSFALLEGLSKALSIERRDLGANVRRVNRNGRMVWEILVIDNVPGGAGYVAQIMREDGLARAFGEAVKVADCESCSEDSTCYSCLRTMSNQRLHDRMRRGPVLEFLRSLCDRVKGEKGIYGVAWQPWASHPDVKEIMLDVPELNSAMAEFVVATRSEVDVTLVVGDTCSPTAAAHLESWRKIWPKRIRVLQRSRSDPQANIGIRRSADLLFLRDLDVSEVLLGVLDRGVLLENEEALRLQRSILSKASDFQAGAGIQGVTVLLPAGTVTSEQKLFGELFEHVVERVRIEDPYLYKPAHEKRLRAWLDLCKTAASFEIRTSWREDLAEKRLQDTMFARLRQLYAPRLRLDVHRQPQKRMHDRTITVEARDQRTLISLPKGLDFIDENGVVEKDTSVTIIPL